MAYLTESSVYYFVLGIDASTIRCLLAAAVCQMLSEGKMYLSTCTILIIWDEIIVLLVIKLVAGSGVKANIVFRQLALKCRSIIAPTCLKLCRVL